MKKIILSAVLVATCFMSQAQKNNSNTNSKLKFSVGADVALPLGSFGDFYSVGLGASAQADYTIAEKTAIGLNVGYMNYSGKSFMGMSVSSTGVVPVLAGVKYGFSEKVYGQAQLGMSFFSNGGGSAFTYAPGIGYQFSPNFDALLKFQGWSNNGSSQQIGLRVAYTF